MAQIVTITQPLNEVPPFSSVTIIGDPGCDGLGTEVLSLYAGALKGAKGDLIVVVGDLVPVGDEPFYRQTDELIERAAEKPVYMLRGNHDTGAYEHHYGLSAYALYDDRTLLIMLDNSLGTFTEDSLAVLQSAVTQIARPDVMLMMHIPPPNSITKKAVSAAEWSKVQEILDASPCAGRVRYLIAGHVHSYFEDHLAGATTLVTGGAGARIAPMAGVETPYNHFVELTRQNDKWQHEKVNLSFANGPKPADDKLAEMLDEGFEAECRAHVRYLLLAEDAEERGMANLGRMYRAIAHAEFIHARNHFYTVGGMQQPNEALLRSLEQETTEVKQTYPAWRDYARQVGDGLAAASFEDARLAEQAHITLLKKAQTAVAAETDIEPQTYYTCTSCGATFFGEKPKRCPVCGAPFDKIEQEP